MGGISDPPSDAVTSGEDVRLDAGANALYAPRASVAKRINLMAKDIATSSSADRADRSV